MRFSFQITTRAKETRTRYSQGGKGTLHKSQVSIIRSKPSFQHVDLRQVRKERMACNTTSSPLTSPGPGRCNMQVLLDYSELWQVSSCSYFKPPASILCHRCDIAEVSLALAHSSLEEVCIDHTINKGCVTRVLYLLNDNK